MGYHFGMQQLALDYPHPYRAWLAIASDPDNTREADWRELHEFIWEELGLPVGNGLFVRSYNENLPGQVNLHDHPWIAGLQPHDTLHTWGDYCFSKSKRFSRKDAVAAMEALQLHGIHPTVWIDHADFCGNLLHNHGRGAVPTIADEAGHQYPNFDYTLDLLEEVGIRYVWNGRLKNFIGPAKFMRGGGGKLATLAP